MGTDALFLKTKRSNAFKERYKHSQVLTHASLAVGANGVSVLSLFFLHFVIQKPKQRRLIGGTLVKALV